MLGVEIEPLPQCKHWITSPTHYPSDTAPDFKNVSSRSCGDFFITSFVIFLVNLLSTKHVIAKYTPHPVLSVRAWNPVAHVHTSLVETLHGSAVATHQSSIWHGDPIRARVTGKNDHRLLSSYVCACSESLCAFICIHSHSLESVEYIELWDRYPVSIRNPTQISRTIWS